MVLECGAAVNSDERGMLWGEPVERDPAQDLDGLEAWRFVNPCDDSCHHPMHAFQVVREARRHLEWFEPGATDGQGRRLRA